MKLFASLFFIAMFVCGCENGTRTAPNVDNSAINQRDQSTRTKTPLDQGENKKDIDITARIRKDVLATKMSSNAHNVKIVTLNGEVTLRGPVATADEKKQIEAIAQNVVGDSRVDNQIDISKQN